MLKGLVPDSGFGNRLSKLLTFAGIGEALGRRVLTFWSTPGNTNYPVHRGRRFYGQLEELRALVHLPRALVWLEDRVKSTTKVVQSGTAFGKISLEDADPFPTEMIVTALQFGWGHPHGVWFYWNYWAVRNLWPLPCVSHSDVAAHMRQVHRQLRPRVDLRNPPSRSYLVLHWRRGDRGDVRTTDPSSFNLTWSCIRAIVLRKRLPWLVIAENSIEVPTIEANLRMHGADVVERAKDENTKSTLRPVVRDFFAISASAGVLFSGARFGVWVDSSFSSMAALVGDIPLLFPHTTSKGGNVAQLQALANKSGEPLRSYFFADQMEGFLSEVSKAQSRPFKNGRESNDHTTLAYELDKYLGASRAALNSSTTTRPLTGTERGSETCLLSQRERPHLAQSPSVVPFTPAPSLESW